MRSPQEFVAKTAIAGPNGVRAYNAGDDVPASAVANLKLVVGQDVIPSSPEILPRPPKSASRADWDAYWRAQGLDQDERDGMTRDDMAAKEPITPDAEKIANTPTVLPGEPVGGFVARFTQPDNVAQQAALQGVGPVTDQTEAGLTGRPADWVEPDRPPSGSRKADWVEYAIAMGMPRQVAEDSTIDQLASADYSLYG
jgi:hypothetical protein